MIDIIQPPFYPVIKIAVSGSRHFHDYTFVSGFLDAFIAKVSRNGRAVELVSGGASGVDTLAERYAEERGYPLHRFPADWKQFGRAAGPIRNKQMAEESDILVAFLSPNSRGTANMINQMNKAGKLYFVVPIELCDGASAPEGE